MKLVFILVIILIVLFYIYHKRTQNQYPIILYQDRKNHPLNDKTIKPYNQQPQDLQYTLYLLGLINVLPQNDFLFIYALLKKWEKQGDIVLKEEENQLNIHFKNTFTENNIENQLYQMLYCLKKEDIVEYDVIKEWMKANHKNICGWEIIYLKDVQNKLKQENRFVDDHYSLDVFQDLKELLGYKKYLDGYKKIETEDENLYAMLFGLKDCPYQM